MRFMVLVKASKESEAGVLPSRELIAKMGKYNQALVQAGVMQAGEGLQPSSKGARVRFSGGKPSVIEGPFSETDQLVAGFWMWQVASRQEAIDWLKRAPFDDATVELRQVYEAEDFAPRDPTGELRRDDAALRAKIDQRR